jgi:hypothetical protein
MERDLASFIESPLFYRRRKVTAVLVIFTAERSNDVSIQLPNSRKAPSSTA